MDFQFYFKRMNSSEILKNMTIRKISDSIEKFVDPTAKVHITFFVNGNMKHAHCGVIAAGGHNFHAEGVSDNIFNAIDIISQKLEAQFQRHKTKLKNRQKQRWDWDRIESLRRNRRKRRSDFDGVEMIDAADIIKFEAAYKPYRARLMH